MQWAYLLADQTLYFAQYDATPARGEGQGAHSAVTQLIQGVWDQEPVHARKILRHRIYTSVAKNERDWGMVKVAAKSITFADASCAQTISEHAGPRVRIEPRADLSEVVIPKDVFLTRAQALERVRELSTLVRRSEHAYESDRGVAALLLAQDGQVLLEALNRNAENRTLHAELRIAQAYLREYQQLIPTGVSWISSLKPCKMCAGMIWACAQSPAEIKVYFDVWDPGPKANPTILSTYEREWEI